ncbi:YczE/YyaS/YitT family protein [Streptomonospora salina]|uniref:Putative membrane protein YczE n=1 Tax=Streptomonospora salina TaxID=104205 RepID=A0A841E7H7_9ACTN|nr:hypothetical protein [Streptomonospora salina]MBB5996510.1 putative membrane protein YczE [Streptomonospora salina]
MSAAPRTSAGIRRLFLHPLLPPPRGRRLVQLYAGLCGFGLGCALLIVSDLGAMPWDVLHQGLARHTGLSVGACSIATAGAVMLLWVPLRQRAGVGTVSNAVVVGLAVDASVWLLPEVEGLAARWAALGAGTVLTGLATGCYIGAGLGPGPRDGLMVGLAERTRLSVRAARTVIEASVVVAGTLLGGTVGIGTLLFAVSIGPLAQLVLPLSRVAPAAADSAAPDADPADPRPRRGPPEPGRRDAETDSPEPGIGTGPHPPDSP